MDEEDSELQTYFLNGPPGFINGVDLVNELDHEMLILMIGMASEDTVVRSPGPQFDQAALNAIKYVFQGFRKFAKFSPNEFGLVLRKYTDLKPSVLEQIVNACGSPPSAVRTVLRNPGKLVSLDWRIGVAMESSMGKQLRHPFVTLLLGIVNHHGQVEQRAVEMSARDFEDFRTKINLLRRQW